MLRIEQGEDQPDRVRRFWPISLFLLIISLVWEDFINQYGPCRRVSKG